MSAIDPIEAALGVRPVPGTPRPFTFPTAVRGRLPGGLALLTVHLPGRPLVSASLYLPNGAVDEPPGEGGATVLAARALTEGTLRHDAVALTEAAERLGASLRAEAGWDATVVGVDVPAERLGLALELLAELAREPAFPEREVERLRDQRLNDILQARVDPARRAEEAFVETIYAAGTPYARVAGGRRETVETLDSGILRAAYLRRGDAERAALIVAGDLAGLDVPALVEPLFGDLTAGAASAEAAPAPPVVEDGLDRTRVRMVHRPGAVQSELRVGHLGLPRRIPDYHAVTVMAMILGGLFNSRLNMKLREEKGYTYGAGAGFDFRRFAGPFSARAAVNTDATVPALVDLLAELRRIREEAPSEAEMRAARDFLVGVFPLRFETPGPIVGSLGGLVTFGLPPDELDRYRPAIDAVTATDVLEAARRHLHIERLAIVVVGDADAVGADLEKAGLGDFEVVRDPDPVAEQA
jgi:predicted Zn-dependent peptidase